MISLILIVEFAIFGLVIAVWQYDSSLTQRVPSGRQPSLCNVSIFAFQMTFVLAKNFLTSTSNAYVFIILFVLEAVLLFYQHFIKRPYYNKVISLTTAVCATVSLWTQAMFFFAKVFERSSFSGAFVVWAIGVFFVLCVTVGLPGSRVDLLLHSWGKA